MHLPKNPPSRLASALLPSCRPVRVFLAAVLLLAAAVALPRSGRAQLLGSLTEGPANAPYTYYLTVEFSNGHYYDFTLRSSVASYTGTAFINAVAAGSVGTPVVLTLDQQTYMGSYYLNGASVNNDTNSGFQNNGYFSYWNGSATNPVGWTYSQVGEDDRTISSGQADGWVFGNDFNGTQMPQAMSFAVPEPSTWAAVGLGLAAGGGVVASRRRKMRA